MSTLIHHRQINDDARLADKIAFSRREIMDIAPTVKCRVKAGFLYLFRKLGVV
jgi:hypothetical protein